MTNKTIEAKDLQAYLVIEATIELRCDEKYKLKESMSTLNGIRECFRVGWQIEDDHNLYAGEWALLTGNLLRQNIFCPGWLASGDVKDIVVIDPFNFC